MTFSEGGERGVIRPGSRRNGGFQPAETRRWAESEGIANQFTGRARIKALKRGGERSGLRSDGRLQAEQERIRLAKDAIQALSPRGTGWIERNGESIPAEGVLFELGEALGVPEGELDWDTAYRMGQWMDPRTAKPAVRGVDGEIKRVGRGGLNLGLEEAYALARAELLSEPKENRSRFQRERESEDLNRVREMFYEGALGRELEAKGELDTQTIGGGLTKGGLEDNDRGLRIYRQGLRTVRGEELRGIAEELGKGKKMGPSGPRNAFRKESGEAPAGGGMIPVLMARLVQDKVDRNGEPYREMGTVQQPRQTEELVEAQKQAYRDARYGRTPAQRAEGQQRLKALMVLKPRDAAGLKIEQAYELKPNGNARRLDAVDAREVRQLLIDPSVVVDPGELGIAEDSALAKLAVQYGSSGPARGMTEVGSFDPVGMVNPDPWNEPVDGGGVKHGLGLEDPGVPRMTRWPTVGQMFARMAGEARTPAPEMVIGDRPEVLDWDEVAGNWMTEGPRVGRGNAMVARVFDENGRERLHQVDVEEVPGAAVQLADGSWVNRSETRPRLGREVFAVPAWGAEQNADGAYVQRFRVGRNAKYQYEKLGAAEQLLRELAALAGVPGDWQFVGNTGLSKGSTVDAAQNAALMQTVGTTLGEKGARLSGEFPEVVGRVGPGKQATPFENSLFTLLDALADGGRPMDADVPARAPAIGPARFAEQERVTGLPVDREAAEVVMARLASDPQYAEMWQGTVRPLVQRARDLQMGRADAAPGMWVFPEMKGGGVYEGARPVAAAPPTFAGVMGPYAVNQGAELPMGLDQRTVVEVLRNPNAFDRQTVGAVQGWLTENVQSPTRGAVGGVGPFTTEEEPSYVAPAARPVDVSAELALNAVTGPGRYGDEVRLQAVPAYGELVRQAQGQAGRWRDPAAGAWDGVDPYWGREGELAPPQWTGPALEQAVPGRKSLLADALAAARDQMSAEASASLAAIGEGVAPVQIAQPTQLPPATIRTAEPGMAGMEWQSQERRPRPSSPYPLAPASLGAVPRSWSGVLRRY